MKAYETIRVYRNSNHSRHEAKRRQRKALRTADNRRWINRYIRDLQASQDRTHEVEWYDDQS